MVGINAAQMAVGTGAEVIVIDNSIDALRRIDAMLGARVKTYFRIATTSSAKYCAPIW